MIDYVAIAQSALENKGSFDELKEASYYEMTIRDGYDIDLSLVSQYIAYDITSGYHRNILIARPKSIWERTKLMIKLTLIILGIKKHGK
jgi:hypothetical protein